MKIIIQCAGSKNAGGYWQTKEGRLVLFVANPQKADHAFPDDPHFSWRKLLVDYNKCPDKNPFNLYHAHELYRHNIYNKLVSKLGVDNVYILSAGWGLIKSDFLIPQYDITFSNNAKPYQKRRKMDTFKDFCMLPENTKETIIFLGGKNYVPLFCSLTVDIKGKKVVFYRSSTPPDAPGCCLKYYATAQKTTWYYRCAREIIEGSLIDDECC